MEKEYPMKKLALSISLTALLSGAATTTQAADVAAGEASFQICKTCHGQQGEGQLALNAPQLAGQYGWYLERQLNHYKAGIRGATPKDIHGAQMRPMSMTLADESAVKNVVAFMETLPVTRPASTLGGDAANGRALYAVCATCHGQNAEGNPALNAPRLNHLSDWYQLRQIKNFKEGIRGNHPRDIFGAQMVPMSMTLADEQAMKDVSAYINSLQ